ncbi:hypothetical protein ACFL3C_03790 [Patescibacteria group bacterium]
MTNIDPADLKARLQELINNSAALKSLPPEARKMRADAMLSSSPTLMQNFINVLEEEATELKKIDEDFVKNAAHIGDLVAEAKELEKEANREIRKEDEAVGRKQEEKEAAALLAKLDDIQDEGPK